ncbi:MAG: hypothetical protein KGP12_10615 [Actinomycetales bacterium]|nr:hypothetical protein [Actinomycetales bacterium]
MNGALQEEQSHVDACYRLLGDLETSLDSRIEATVRAPSTGTGQDLRERDALLEVLLQQRRAARAAHARLCFGRIDLADGTSHHIGRIGLRSADGEPLLLDWRAPQAAPFYQATAASPLGVARRRRIITRGRAVTHVDDEVLGTTSSLVALAGDAASRSVEAPREGRMGDIVATIAADQDAIIRSPLGQVTVVEGGPGTGKTVVALHRAAWLLYTYRERLAKDGVLIIGPSATFLHYIEQVLPSLGETDVVLLTPGQLFPGIDAREQDEPDVSRIKGDIRMASVVARAVDSRIRIPGHDVTIELEDGSRVSVTARQLQQARASVPRRAAFHAGRDPFLTSVLGYLGADRARALREDPRDAHVRAGHVADLVEDPGVRRALNLMWLPTTPEQLIRRLLTDPGFLAIAAAGVLRPGEQARLIRPLDSAWTVDDVPLLDEAAERLGPWDPAAADADARHRRERAQELQQAQAALADTGAAGWIDAAGLIDRMAGRADVSTVAERAWGDRTWVFGHIVVDEAQELSRMAWHCLARRAGRRSMTVVGDLQQASHPAGARDWAQALEPVGGRIDLHRLTVTYRITRQVADEATRLLIAAGGSAPVLSPVRDGDPVEHSACRSGALAALILQSWQAREGRAAVIVPDATGSAIADLLCQASDAFGRGDAALDAPIAVLAARQSKGLEFDEVFIVDPRAIASQARLGSDIYVAATRPTRWLHVITLVDD